MKRDDILEAISVWNACPRHVAEKHLDAYMTTRGAVRMGQLGQDTGLVDRNGEKVCIGDKLEFDAKEWGGPHRFQVGWEEGQLSISGTPSDIPEWCTVVEKWEMTYHPNGAPKWSPSGTLLDDKGNRSIFDDVDK